ncbi:hypothetical protein ARMSODRAFT_1007283 [Armillaria solidipes]|uniref:Uncharacterized protein n=1 Tax=Armillaria solidipes TaxID=1076256 RepID=A0A2H3BMB0_9AGAR|nr:hypothetical protein ARMSODRAFT_1007283 [Armillaria solidipes]
MVVVRTITKYDASITARLAGCASENGRASKSPYNAEISFLIQVFVGIFTDLGGLEYEEKFKSELLTVYEILGGNDIQYGGDGVIEQLLEEGIHTGARVEEATVFRGHQRKNEPTYFTLLTQSCYKNRKPKLGTTWRQPLRPRAHTTQADLVPASKPIIPQRAPTDAESLVERARMTTDSDPGIVSLTVISVPVLRAGAANMNMQLRIMAQRVEEVARDAGVQNRTSKIKMQAVFNNN